MAVKYGKFQMPDQIEKDGVVSTERFARFIAEPLEKGYAHTVGNTLRRVLLTGLEAPAIIGIRIEGVQHEYMAIDGVIEDMVNIILNLKGALLRRLQNSQDSSFTSDFRLHTNIIEVSQDQIDKGGGKHVVTLGELLKDSRFDVVNPEMPLFTVTKPFSRQIDMRFAVGRGYVPSERLQVSDRGVDEILIDACFSPVRLVSYTVENTRVGQDTDFDKLILDITTDGRVSPAEALAFAAQIAQRHFEVFCHYEGNYLAFDENSEEDDAYREEIMEKLALRIDEIELSVRSTNCLSGAGIEFIGELVVISERRMLEFRNFGKKSLFEIKAKLVELGLRLGLAEELKRYGINENNVRTKILEFLEESKNKRELAAQEQSE